MEEEEKEIQEIPKKPKKGTKYTSTGLPDSKISYKVIAKIMKNFKAYSKLF